MAKKGISLEYVKMLWKDSLSQLYISYVIQDLS